MFPGIAAGRPILAIYDVEARKIEREIRFPTLGEIFTTSWSPDGEAIAFSAVTGGLTDLYVYYLESGQLRRLTDDQYADLQPPGRPTSAASPSLPTDSPLISRPCKSGSTGWPCWTWRTVVSGRSPAFPA